MFLSHNISFIGKLTSAEEVGVGDIGFSTYKSYVSAAGGPCIAIICTLCYLITFGVVVFADVWLSKWIETFEVRSAITHIIQID